uniref:Uncharacterized protein n=1 Tax=Rhizophora mucronata TaxID=61149 RepID=A0A2P2N9E4_RHIMU
MQGKRDEVGFNQSKNMAPKLQRGVYVQYRHVFMHIKCLAKSIK